METYVNDVGRPAQSECSFCADINHTKFTLLVDIYIRHGPEAQSVFVTFACSFLVKVMVLTAIQCITKLFGSQLLQPKFAAYLAREQRLEIRNQVEKVANLLGSPEVAIDDRHGPKLYSRFLKGLLATPLANADVPSPVIAGGNQPQRRSARKEKGEAGNTPDSEKSLEISLSNGFNGNFTLSPNTFQSPSADASLDVFAPLTGAHSALVSQAHYASANRVPNTIDHSTMSNNDWFSTPLPFDSELVQSMQSVQDIFGENISLPGKYHIIFLNSAHNLTRPMGIGFNWMNSFQTNNDDIYMHYSDPSVNVFDYNLKTPPP